MKKVLSILTFTFTLIFMAGIMPRYAFAKTFIPAQEQIERAKTIDGFDFDIFKRYLPEVPYDFDFDEFLDILEEFGLVMQEHPIDVEPIVIDDLNELRGFLEETENFIFNLNENYEKYNIVNEFDLTRNIRETSRNWSVSGGFIVPNPRETLFVSYILITQNGVTTVNRINHHGWSLNGFTAGASMTNDVSSAHGNPNNRGFQASGSITINQHLAFPVLLSHRFTGSYTYTTPNLY